MKSAGVPVELKVATSLFAMFALLPIPVNTTLPEDARRASTVPVKPSSRKLMSCATASDSSVKVFRAEEMMEVLFFNGFRRIKFREECSASRNENSLSLTVQK